MKSNTGRLLNTQNFARHHCQIRATIPMDVGMIVSSGATVAKFHFINSNLTERHFSTKG